MEKEIKEGYTLHSQGRLGYGINRIYTFYRAFRDSGRLIKDMDDFKVMILPMFYFLHGEEYDSTN